MGGIGLAHRQAILAASVAGATLAAVDELWLALCREPINADAATGATLVEVQYVGYARARVPAAAWGAPDAYGRISNVADIAFPQVQAAEEGMDAGAWALLDAAAIGTGNIRWCGATPQLLITPDDPLVIPPGVLVCAITGG